MNGLMTKEEYDRLIKRLEANELYQKSKSIHKGFQFKLFTDPKTGRVVVGQQVREENGRIVIYNFTEGLLNSENDEPAIQYPGHWEYWDKGVIKKVVANGGDTEEYWENGVPVRIENNLAERRRVEEEKHGDTRGY